MLSQPQWAAIALEALRSGFWQDRLNKDQIDFQELGMSPWLNLEQLLIEAAEIDQIDAVSELLSFASQHGI